MKQEPETQRIKPLLNTAWIGDVILLLFAVILYFHGNDHFLPEKIDSRSAIVQFLIIITAIPWYGGYLLHHFAIFPKALRILCQWSFAIIILGMITYLVIFMFPLLENDPNDPYTIFLLSFGMFFLVLGPMMLIGGYADAPFLDTPIKENQKIPSPMTTIGMFILIIAILFMVLIIGLFDPTWSGNAGFLAVMAGFFGGPLAAVILCIPFIMLGEFIKKRDQNQIIIRTLRFLIPVIFFLTLIRWNELILSKTIHDWGYGQVDHSSIFLSLIFSGIIPFRILILLKPPFSLLQLITGILSLTLYLMALINCLGNHQL